MIEDPRCSNVTIKHFCTRLLSDLTAMEKIPFGEDTGKFEYNLVQKCFIVTFEHLGSSIMCYLEKSSPKNISLVVLFSDIVGFSRFLVARNFSRFTFSGCFLSVSGWLNF